MNTNWYPTYPDGKEILVAEDASLDSWLLDRFSAQLLIDNPDRIRDMNECMCKLWLDYYNRLSILPKKKKSDPSISIKEIKIAVRERLALIKSTRKSFDVAQDRREKLEQYVGTLNMVCDRVERRPAGKNRIIKNHGSTYRNTLYDFEATPTGLYSEAAYKLSLIHI